MDVVLVLENLAAPRQGAEDLLRPDHRGSVTTTGGSRQVQNHSNDERVIENPRCGFQLGETDDGDVVAVLSMTGDDGSTAIATWDHPAMVSQLGHLLLSCVGAFDAGMRLGLGAAIEAHGLEYRLPEVPNDLAELEAIWASITDGPPIEPPTNGTARGFGAEQ